MGMDDRQRRRARLLRVSRTVHRTTGALLFVFFLVVACTGLLLGWKKDTGGLNPISIPTSVELDTSTGAKSRRIMSLATMHLAAIRAYCSPMHRRGPIPNLALEKHPENLFPPGIF